MLDKNDIQQIGAIVKENIEESNKKLTHEIVLQVGEMIEQNVLPQIDKLSSDLAEAKSDLTDVKKIITTLPNRDDLSRGLADVKGVVVAQLRREDEKVNLLIKFLREKNILTEEQWKTLSALQVFPMIEI